MDVSVRGPRRWWTGVVSMALGAGIALGAAGASPTAAADAPLVLSVDGPSGAEVGQVVTLDLRIEPPHEDIPDARLVIDLSAGLRPLEPPSACRVDGAAWRITCELPLLFVWADPVAFRVHLLATAEGFPGVRVAVRVPDRRKAVASEQLSFPVTQPEVVARYAPQFRFHRIESRWPASVETLLADSALMYAWDRCPDDTAVPTGQVTTDQLGMPGGGDPVVWPQAGRRLCGADATHDTGQNTRPGGQDEFYARAAIPGSTEGFYLSIGETGQKGIAPAEGAGTYDVDVPVYYQYRAPDPKLGDGWIRYWVLYGCSYPATLVDPRFAKPREGECFHQGDWEGVAVRLDRDTGYATDLAYFAHEDPADIRVFAPDGPDPFVDPVVEVVAGDGETTPTHPVVYVGAGSHSSRIRAGDHAACLKVDDRIVYCGTDQTADDLRWDSWRDLRSAEDTWFGFGGAWGAVGPIQAAAGVHGPGGPGLVDPLPEQWSDDDVPRCRAGEVHPESRGTLSSCIPGKGVPPKAVKDLQAYCQSSAQGIDASGCSPDVLVALEWADRTPRPDGYRLYTRAGAPVPGSPCDDRYRPTRVKWTRWKLQRDIAFGDTVVSRADSDGTMIRTYGHLELDSRGGPEVRFAADGRHPMIEYAIAPYDADGEADRASWMLLDYPLWDQTEYCG